MLYRFSTSKLVDFTTVSTSPRSTATTSRTGTIPRTTYAATRFFDRPNQEDAGSLAERSLQLHACRCGRRNDVLRGGLEEVLRQADEAEGMERRCRLDRLPGLNGVEYNFLQLDTLGGNPTLAYGRYLCPYSSNRSGAYRIDV